MVCPPRNRRETPVTFWTANTAAATTQAANNKVLRRLVMMLMNAMNKSSFIKGLEAPIFRPRRGWEIVPYQ